MENRYDGLLEKHNQAILDLYPPSVFFWNVAAKEIQKHISSIPDARVLEIGCGEGHSTLRVLRHTMHPMDVLDVSAEMLEKCKKRLESFGTECNFIREDALHYLRREVKTDYSVIYSSQVIHNFTQKEKLQLFFEIHSSLAPDGLLILFDKIYPTEDEQDINRLLEIQLERYRYLDPEVYQVMVQHEIQDARPEHRMTEDSVRDQLERAGFLHVDILDRVERDVLLIAKK